MIRATSFAALAALVLAGCATEPDRTDATVIATLGEATLTAGELTRILRQAPEAPGQVQGLAVVGMWLDHAAIVTAAAKSDDLTAAEIRDPTLEPDILKAAIFRLSETIHAGRPAPTDAAVDSLARSGNVRAFDRYTVPGIGSASDSAEVRAAAGRLLALANAANAATGALPASATAGVTRQRTEAVMRTQLDPALADALWDLEPGKASPPVAGSGTLQVFARLRDADAREELRTWLTGRDNLRADSIYIDSLATAANITFPTDLGARVRQLATEPIAAGSGAPLATFTGGEVPESDARAWFGLMSPAIRANATTASDSAVMRLVTDMAKRRLMAAIAPAEGDSAARARLQGDYAAAIGQLTADLATTPASTPSIRTMAWLNQMLEGKRLPMVLPGSLGYVLRQRYGAIVDMDALLWVVRRIANEWGAATS
jgi:hypothetical protein